MAPLGGFVDVVGGGDLAPTGGFIGSVGGGDVAPLGGLVAVVGAGDVASLDGFVGSVEGWWLCQQAGPSLAQMWAFAGGARWRRWQPHVMVVVAGRDGGRHTV